MSQNDMTIANADGATIRADINSALQALASSNKGSSSPSTTYSGQVWWDTSNNKIKIRNTANSGWVDWAYYDGTTLRPLSGGDEVAKNPIDTSTSTVYKHVVTDQVIYLEEQ